jgi:hypothetical protein
MLRDDISLLISFKNEIRVAKSEILQPFFDQNIRVSQNAERLCRFQILRKILRFNTLGGKILMKTIYKNLALGMLLTVFAVFSVAPVSAQTPQDEKTKLYNTYIENYDKSLDKQKSLSRRQSSMSKIRSYAEDKEQVDYFKNAIPSLEEGINKVERETKKRWRLAPFLKNSTRRTKQKHS